MAYQSQVPNVEHGVIKPAKQIAAAHGILERELVLPNFFHKESIMKFAGSEGDTLTYKLPGVLPWREYEMRNDRTDPLIFDSFSEAKVSLTVTGRIYQGVRITDEQNDFDELGVLDVIPIQAAAVARGIEQTCVRAFNNVEYPVVIGKAEQDHFGAAMEARRILNRMGASTRRTMLVGSDYGASLVQSERVSRAINSGDRIAATALEDARVGRLAGMDIIESSLIAPDEAIVFTGDAFTLFTGAPQPPTEVGLTAAARNYQGIAMTWLRDYETERLMRRSVLVTYVGAAPAQDFLQKYNETTRLPERSTTPHFVRGVKLSLTGASAIVNPDVNAFSELYAASNTTGYTPRTGTIK